MSFGSYNGRGERPNNTLKAWSRAKATPWDAKWSKLTPDARRAFLEQTKGPSKPSSTTRPSTSAAAISPADLDELLEAGFILVEKGVGKSGPKVFVASEVYDFALRLRSVHRFHLLGPNDLASIESYCRYVFHSNGEVSIARVLINAGIEDLPPLERALERYVSTHHWPTWAAEEMGSPLAKPLIDALIKAPGPIPLADLAKKVPGPAAEVEKALAGLIERAAVFEDVDGDTQELVVGLLRIVRQRIEESAKPRSRPALIVVDRPKELGPHMGLLGNDLRVFLMEVIGLSPRLRQDGKIFAKEEPRFLEALPPWPSWLVNSSRLTPTERLSQAHDWAVELKFVEQVAEEDRTQLQLSARGKSWLAADSELQYTSIYDALRDVPKRSQSHYYYTEDLTAGDALFFGVSALVRPVKKNATPLYRSSYSELKPEDRKALRDAVYKALDTLPVGIYFTLQSILFHLVYGDHNPLMLGKKDPKTLSIQLDHTRIPQLEDAILKAGQVFLGTFILRRLVTFDAMTSAVDEKGHLCLARLPRMDGYFGRKVKVDTKATKVESKVIVQPDFSIVVIGLDPAPAVDLAPFCDRSQGQAGQGAMIFKLSRESVIRAVSQGMKTSEILNRLNKHASVAVPANVLAEVREWAGWTRQVNVGPILAIRCPDAETVARVVAALGRQAQKLSDTLVGLSATKLTSADRTKLQQHGILITKRDITVAEGVTKTAPSSKNEPVAAAKRRGRPRKEF